MSNEINAYEAEEISLGDKKEKNKIVFKSVEELNKAYRDIDNGNEIYIKDVRDGLIRKIPNKMLTLGVYTGEIDLCAKQKQGEKIGGVK